MINRRRRRAIALMLAVTAAGMPTDSGAGTGAEIGVFTSQSTVQLDSGTSAIRSCASLPPRSGATKLNWTYDSATGRRGVTFDGCIWINSSGSENRTAELEVDYLRSDNTLIVSRSTYCFDFVGGPSQHKCVLPTGTATFGLPPTTGLAKARLRFRSTGPDGPLATTTILPGATTDRDTVALTSAPSSLRSCAAVPPNSGSTTVAWTVNSSGQVGVGFDGCLWINRLGATTARLTVEYRRANGSVITTRNLDCSKGLTASPYKKCVLTNLDLPATSGLDRITLKLRTTSPTSPLTTASLISGD